jgi:site-specific recombinase XerD
VRPHLASWSATRTHLREVTPEDVRAALDQLSGHRRVGTFVALRSLFGFAKRQRLVFRDPTQQMRVGRAPRRSLVPLTDAEIAAIQDVVVTPAQRLVVALAAVHAARAAAIRHLTLDDLDLDGRRIRLAGHTQPLSPFVHQMLLSWLQHRHRTWPRTRNRHVLLSATTARNLAPVSDYFVQYHLLQRGVQLEQIRGDRFLQEALACGADPLHLALAFNISAPTAIVYCDIARSLLDSAAEAAPATASDATSIEHLP